MENNSINSPQYSYPDRRRNAYRRYGITLEEYDTMLAEQNFVCAICKNPESMKHKSGRFYNLSIDHDHDTSIVRGLLCRNCNVGLGNFSDDIEKLSAAITYLSKSVNLD